MKYLFVVILHKNDNAYALFAALRRRGISGTVLPAQSLLSSFLNNPDEPLPLFGSLRQVVEYPEDNRFTVFCIVDDEKLALAREAVKEVSDAKKEKLGVTFSIKLDSVEGDN